MRLFWTEYGGGRSERGEGPVDVGRSMAGSHNERDEHSGSTTAGTLDKGQDAAAA
jgi:hypothetical protein